MKRKLFITIYILVVIIVAITGYIVFLKPSNKQTLVNIDPENSNQPVNNIVVKTAHNSQYGSYLTTPSNQTLYIYSGDKLNVSNCTGGCLALWPPYVDRLTTTGLPINIGVFRRTDNKELQFSYKGQPLYTYVNDKPGQINGQNVAGFSLARP
jgi:predicted lipoprotein with Yx(FWY)xxD motif